MRRVITDKDGRMRTENAVPGPSPKAMEELRREVRDIVAGNVPFHTDPNAAPKPADPPDEPNEYEWSY